MPTKDPVKRKAICKMYYENNKEKATKATRKWQDEHHERCLENKRIWKKANPDKVKEQYQRWWNKNPEKSKKLFRKYAGDRRKTINGNLVSRIAPAMSRSLREGKGGRSWESLVGYTVDDLRKHIENQFIEGMNWENKGLWHIDHKIPLSAFNFQTPEDDDFHKAWALSNLQPLWAKENLSKGGIRRCQMR